MKTKRNLIRFWLLGAALLTLNLQTSTAIAQPVTQVAAGYHHSLFLKSDGGLWVIGDDSAGELGDGRSIAYNSNTNRPEQIVGSNVTAVTAGNFDSLFLETNGSLWAMGSDMYGQLGDGDGIDNPTRNRPELIMGSNVTAIAAGNGYNLFLKSDGSLWTMGGIVGGNYETNLPEQIVASNVTVIAAGGAHNLFLKNDGSLWAMGNNGWGQLGDGTYNRTNQPEQIVGSNVTAIAAGYGHSLFLKSDGSLWAMGDNDVGELGDGTTDNGNYATNLPEEIVGTNVTAIAAGYSHSLFLKSDGSLWAMGDNFFGDLGDGTYNSTNRPEQIVASNVIAIAAGEDFSLFLKSDGSLWAMGLNDDGELGDGTYNNTNRPEQIVAGPPGYGYNQMSIRLLNGGNVCSYYGGTAGTNYALDRTFSLSPPDWIPQVTNPANVFGVAAFTNTPDPTANNYWRVRSVQ
jgi:alpha-tubulin suppressor-like RCC1 family protein